MKRILPLIALCLILSGCGMFSPIKAHDPINQAKIDDRTRLEDARRAYSIAERQINNAFAAHAISKATHVTLKRELQGVVHPLLNAADDALISGDFQGAILKFESALNTLNLKATPTTQPIHPGSSLFN